MHPHTLARIGRISVLGSLSAPFLDVKTNILTSISVTETTFLVETLVGVFPMYGSFLMMMLLLNTIPDYAQDFYFIKKKEYKREFIYISTFMIAILIYKLC